MPQTKACCCFLGFFFFTLPLILTFWKDLYSFSNLKKQWSLKWLMLQISLSRDILCILQFLAWIKVMKLNIETFSVLKIEFWEFNLLVHSNSRVFYYTLLYIESSGWSQCAWIWFPIGKLQWRTGVILPLEAFEANILCCNCIIL